MPKEAKLAGTSIYSICLAVGAVVLITMIISNHLIILVASIASIILSAIFTFPIIASKLITINNVEDNDNSMASKTVTQTRIV